MSVSQILEGKRAVVYGAAGSIGSAVAKAFAAEGATVFLAGRTAATVEAVAAEITTAGGLAHAHLVDTLDADAVDAYVDTISERAGGLDVSFDATGPRIGDYRNGMPAVDITVDDFLIPVNTVLRSQFTTARAAARRMIDQRSGAIVFLTGSPAKPHGPGTTGIGAAFSAVENLMRTMAIELGPTGVRSVGLRIAANPDTRTIRDTSAVISKMMNITPDQAVARLAESTLLKVSPHTADTARAAAFLASDGAAMMTGTVLNSSAGAVAD